MHEIMKLMSKKFIFFINFLSIWAFPILVLAESKSIVKPTSVEAFSMMGALNMAMGLVVVIAFILGLAWVLKKYSKLPGVNQVDMKVLGGISLGTREKAILIEVENTRLLVGVTPGHIQTLHVLQGKSDSNSVVPNADSFQSKLNDQLEIDK